MDIEGTADIISSFLNMGEIEKMKKINKSFNKRYSCLVENYKQNLVIVLKIFKYAIKLAKITDSKDYRLCLMEKMIHYKNCIGQRNEKSIKYHNEIDSLMKEYFESVL
jgi:hypothetical protein